MSALLRNAATKMREDDDARWVAVADWLERNATWSERASGASTPNADVIARAYLGGDA